jgi:hypothetical protein
MIVVATLSLTTVKAIFNSWGGVKLSPLGTQVNSGPIEPAIDDK